MEMNPMTERKSNKASCAICGVQAGYHSLRESGICDGIRNGYLDATTKERIVVIVAEPLSDLEQSDLASEPQDSAL